MKYLTRQIMCVVTRNSAQLMYAHLERFIGGWDTPWRNELKQCKAPFIAHEKFTAAQLQLKICFSFMGDTMRMAERNDFLLKLHINVTQCCECRRAREWRANSAMFMACATYRQFEQREKATIKYMNRSLLSIQSQLEHLKCFLPFPNECRAHVTVTCAFMDFSLSHLSIPEAQNKLLK